MLVVKSNENIELGVEFRMKVSVQYPVSNNGHKQMLGEGWEQDKYVWFLSHPVSKYSSILELFSAQHSCTYCALYV